MRHILLLLFAGMVLFSCKENTEGLNKDVVVMVYDNKLDINHIESLVPKDIVDSDSIELTQRYIQKWIIQNLITQKAIFNVGEDDDEINRMVNDYKNSLIVKKYKEELLEKKADIIPTEEEITNFYKKNSASYPLKEDIIQGILLKIPIDAPRLNDLRKWLEIEDDEAYSEIESYCYQRATTFDDFREKWVSKKLISKILPDGYPNSKRRKSAYIEQSDSLNAYFLKITNLKLKNDTAPQMFVEDKIITILRHKKKLEFFNTFEKDIYNEGIKNGSVVYNSIYE